MKTIEYMHELRKMRLAVIYCEGSFHAQLYIRWLWFWVPLWDRVVDEPFEIYHWLMFSRLIDEAEHDRIKPSIDALAAVRGWSC